MGLGIDTVERRYLDDAEDRGGQSARNLGPDRRSVVRDAAAVFHLSGG